MVRATNLILALFLALAPGMDAVRAIHALELCGHSTQAEHADDTGHHDGAPERQPGECPQFSQLPQNLPVLNFDASPSVELPPPPQVCALAMFTAPETTMPQSGRYVRPPPGPPLVGCVILKI